MEDTSPQLSLLLPILAAALFIFLIKALAYYIQRPKLQNLPPGPSPLPIIGNLHNLTGDQPHRRLAALSKIYGPVLYLKLGEIDSVVITSASVAAESMKTHDLALASRSQFLATKIILYDGGDLVFAPHGRTWTQLRKICTVELFSTKRVRSFLPIIDEINVEMVQKIRAAGNSAINVTELLLAIANTTVSRTAFGRECEQSDRLFTAVTKSFKYMSGFDLADLYPSMGPFIAAVTGLRRRSENLRRDFDFLLNDILAAHMEKKGGGGVEGGDGGEVEEDLVDVLLRLKGSGQLEHPISMDNVKAVIVDLILGGTETTSAIMTWAISELVRHPAVISKLQSELRTALRNNETIAGKEVADLPYLNAVLKETMRLHPPAPFLVPRDCRETINLGGHTIPAGSRVILNAWAIMRDRHCWGDDAEEFRPERFEDSGGGGGGGGMEGYIPFGGGRRVCPGISFGMASMTAVIASLMYYFDWGPSDGRRGEELDMEEEFGLSLVRKNDLMLIATPYEYYNN